MSKPCMYSQSNHASAFSHEDIVDNAAADLVRCGLAREPSEASVHAVSPLGVVEGRKLRLVC